MPATSAEGEAWGPFQETFGQRNAARLDDEDVRRWPRFGLRASPSESLNVSGSACPPSSGSCAEYPDAMPLPAVLDDELLVQAMVNQPGGLGRGARGLGSDGGLSYDEFPPDARWGGRRFSAFSPSLPPSLLGNEDAPGREVVLQWPIM